jgi:hypothetical protein
MTMDATDWTVAANGDIRYMGDAHGVGSPTYATVIEFHRWLQDLADNASASGDDLLDITDSTPSDRSTDNIITLLPPYNIDDTAAEHLYDGSITQANGDTQYSGLVVVGAVETGTELQIVQDNQVVTSYWGTGLNANAAANILLRIMLKTRVTAADIDGKRIRVFARELGDTYSEFSATLGQGNSTAAIFTGNDLNNQTAGATISGWVITNANEGRIGLDVNQDSADEYYYSEWSKGARSINDVYEKAKWLQMRGSAETMYGMDGELFRGITHQFAFSAQTGSFTQNEEVSWGSGATAGTGALLAQDDQGTTGTLWVQQLTGAAPVAALTVTGASGSATIGTVTARTVPSCFIGQSTGSALIGAYGVGLDPNDLTASDLLFDLTNTPITPPNNVQFSVTGLVDSEDRVLVGPATGGVLDEDQLTLNTTLNGAAVTSVVVTTTIPTDTPLTGTIRVQLDTGVYKRVPYTSYSGSTFTIPSTDFTGVNQATAPKNVFISYIDDIAGATGALSYTAIYSGSDRNLFIRVRDGGATPIKTFETPATFRSAAQSIPVIRTPDV